MVLETLTGLLGKLWPTWIAANAIQPVNRPEWDDYFLVQAIIASSRSMDSQTKHGAVLVRDKKVISTGYNGFPAGCPDDKLPNVRPWKYAYILHSEKMAVLNCENRPTGATCYVTGEPCKDCLYLLHGAGVQRVVYVDTYGSVAISDEDRQDKELLVEMTGLKVEKCTPDYSWLIELLKSKKIMPEQG